MVSNHHHYCQCIIHHGRLYSAALITIFCFSADKDYCLRTMQCFPSNSRSVSANPKHHYDSLICWGKHSSSSEANHCHQSEPAGYLPNQPKHPHTIRQNLTTTHRRSLLRHPANVWCVSHLIIRCAAVGVNDGYMGSYPQPHFRTPRPNQHRTKDIQTTQPQR